MQAPISSAQFAGVANTPDVVSSNTPQNPYKEFTMTLQVNDRQRIYYASNYFRVLALTLNTLSVNFYGTTQTSFVGAGIGVKLPDILPWVELINTGGAPVVLTVAMGVGEFFDNRLTVTGNINSVIVSGATLTDVADVAVLTGATTQVQAASALTKTVIISNLAANGTKIRVGSASAGAARGIEVPIGGSVSLDTAAAVFVFNPSGGTINIGVEAIQL